MPMMIATVQETSAPAPAAPDVGDVVVVGVREGFRLNVRALRAAQAAFLKRRAAFAPRSTLSFVIERRDGGPLAAGVHLDLVDGKRRIGVPVRADHSFVLDGLPPGDWRLEVALSRRSVRIEPVVLSPGSSRYAYRLGDGRLQCRVSWAMMKASVPILAAPLVGAADAIGPCTSRRIGLYSATPAPIRTAVLTDSQRTVPVEVGPRRRSYRFPGGDPTFSDEARVAITLEYERPPTG